MGKKRKGVERSAKDDHSWLTTTTTSSNPSPHGRPHSTQTTSTSKKKRKIDHSSSTSLSSSKRTHGKSKGPDEMLETDSTTFTTPSGAILTLQTAGFVLSNYIQSFGEDPRDFKSSSSFTIIPPSHPIEYKRPHKPLEPHQPPPDSLFHCTITLPSPCAISSLTSQGEGFRSKDLAKRHAAIELVKALIDKKEIGPDLKPTPLTKRKKPTKKDKRYERVAEHVQRRLASPSPLSPPDPEERAKKITSFKMAMLDRLPSISPAPSSTSLIPGQADYLHLAHSTFWDDFQSFKPDQLWPTVIELLPGPPYENRADECRLVCLITTQPLPIFNDNHTLTLDIGNPSAGMDKIKVEAVAKLLKGRKMKTWEDGKLEEAMDYTRKLIRAHTNKPLVGDLESSKWILVPIIKGYKSPVGESIKVRRRDIAWDEVTSACQSLWTPFSADNPMKLKEEIIDAMTTPKYEFARRSYLYSLRTDLDPSSPHPALANKTIHQSVSTNLELNLPSQSILEGEQVHPTKNGGYIASLGIPNLRGRFHIPEITQRHCISASVYRTASTLPTILRIVDDMLVAGDLSEKVFAGRLRNDLALQAISSPTAHSTAPLKSYQRLEMLGDTLLKFLVAVYLLYRSDGNLDWDRLHQDRQVMVSNRTLHARAYNAGVVPYIRGAVGKMKEWVPMGWWEEPIPPKPKEVEADSKDQVRQIAGDKTIENDGSKELGGAIKLAEEKKVGMVGEQSKNGVSKEHKQLLGDKVIADVAEALVAAAYLSSNSRIDSAISAMHALGMPIKDFNNWMDVATYTVVRIAGHLNGLNAPLSILKYAFTKPENGRDALTLSSDHHRRAHFMKYRILGDAVLDYFMVEGLYHQYPECSPGALTVMRHSRHGDACLAAFCVTSGLVDNITDIPVDIMPQIKRFKTSVVTSKKREDIAKDESGKLEFWAEIPTLSYLGDIVNAVLGAILVDSNYDIEVARKIYTVQVLPFLERYCVGPTEQAPHPRTIWSEMIFKRGCSKWELRQGEEKTTWGMLVSELYFHDQLIGKGEAENAVLATRKACEEAVKRAKNEGLLDNLCTCPKKKKGRGML